MTRLVVFDIHGLSIRSAGCYGNVETPTRLLNEFSAQAMLFEQHYRSSTVAADDLEAAIGSFPRSMTPVRFRARSDKDATVPTSTEPSEGFESLDHLAELLENQLEPETAAAWVHLRAEGEVDSAVPLALISGLVEQGVLVAITSTSPTDEPQVRQEESIRVPLMIWTGEPSRVQTVTSSADLAEVLGVANTTGESDRAVIAAPEHVAVREPDGFLIASRLFLLSLPSAAITEHAGHLDLTGEEVQLFRKPDDVWNVHNVLVEEPARANEILARLRNDLAR